MTEYIKMQGKGLLPKGSDEKMRPFLTIMSMEEFKERHDIGVNHEVVHTAGSIRYCKAEWLKECFEGALRIPDKSAESDPQMSFAFHISDNYAVFIESEGDLKKWLEKHLESFDDIEKPIQLLLRMSDRFLEGDLLYLYHMEKEMDTLENTVFDSAAEDVFLKLTGFRRKLSELDAYYAQMAAVGETAQEGDLEQNDGRAWERFTRRAERLQDHVGLLRENIMRLRELIASVQAERQNRIMGILTVVTTIFLPLTLLTGWYGMNFQRMPELGWKYGYPAAAAAALAVVIFEIIWFKRKKFF